MSREDAARVLDVEVYTLDGATVIAARGEIDILSVPLLQSSLEQAHDDGVDVVVDMSEVGFMGSAGLSALLAAAEGAEPQKLRVVASSAVRRPIEVTGLDKVLAVFATLDDALASGEPIAAG
ncbi:STAS domain-containing protein [Nocardia sp. CA2R105]|uniref:anti-sigma factor antagonist n=1 Tax=Nocardia coffeae TaxID=2873381 RepID=UPI001CA6C9F9|nr:anti-sigma factor antagonist [Nocardia coffeae]MBY8862094.1 STAS domain-containing protein [Nocardia coffeae]